MVDSKIPLFQRIDGSTDVKIGEGIKILLGKHHGKILWKNLFKPDWKFLGMMTFIIVMVLIYKHDTAACQEVIKNPASFCSDYCNKLVYVFSDDDVSTVWKYSEVNISEGQSMEEEFS